MLLSGSLLCVETLCSCEEELVHPAASTSIAPTRAPNSALCLISFARPFLRVAAVPYAPCTSRVAASELAMSASSTYQF